MMRHYHHEFEVNAPLHSVAEFHSSTNALRQLTPPPMVVKFNHMEPLSEGSRSDFTLWFGPIPIHWVAIHSDVDLSKGFTDTQVEGPFQIWVHQHTFHSISEHKTRIIDEIQAQVSAHFFWGVISRFMWLTLPVLFSYRASQTRKAVSG